jgi:predicted nucleic acid-binding protein
MKFWDASALVPLLLPEKESGYVLKVLKDDPEMLIWCTSRAEVVSALTRRLRDQTLASEHLQTAKKRFNRLLESVYQITSVEKVITRALRLLEVHPLRAADACQLASALVATQEDPARLPIICFDHRLNAAAMKEGFVVNP